MMKEYMLKTFEDINWNNVDKAKIDTFRWSDNGYEPETYAQCAIKRNIGLCVKFTCFEKNPLALKKNFCNPVFEDSCMEFFACMDNGKEYINIETNSAGVCTATLRTAKEVIAKFDEVIGIPKIITSITDEYWTAEFTLTFDEIKKLFPSANLCSGSSFGANFYKCGDKTEKPHFGMWNEVNCENPTFHQPDRFGKIIIL